jgi:Zn-dependent peptidase ImmA (M78 family)
MNTTEFGNVLEKQIHDYFVALINANEFILKKECCRFFWKKAYYSHQRKSDIIFDVAIEVWLPGAATFSMVVLIECKRYTNRNVPVGDVEQFFQKVQQVAAGNSKAILVSNVGFDLGVRNFAESNGIGLLRFIEKSDVKWELRRSSWAELSKHTSLEASRIDDALATCGTMYHTVRIYARYKGERADSIWSFVETLINASDLSAKEIRQLTNRSGPRKNNVPFVKDEEIENKTLDILASIKYVGGPVPLMEICDAETANSGLTIVFDALPMYESRKVRILGKITFLPNVITIYSQDEENKGRDRFTLAHELGHLLLGHSDFIGAEYSDEEDFDSKEALQLKSPEIARLEYQANAFATSLLMPRSFFLAKFEHAARMFDVKDKGFGKIYVDNQPCNQQDFYLITSSLMREFEVSRAAVVMRLKHLKLLTDMRSQAAPISSFLFR